MTQLQVLDLQLINDNYYWCKIKNSKKEIILQYSFDDYFFWTEFYMCGYEIAIELKNIEYINPHQIMQG